MRESWIITVNQSENFDLQPDYRGEKRKKEEASAGRLSQS